MNNMQTKVSYHAAKRIKERCGVGKRSADRVTSLAYERGVVKERTKGALRKWLDSKDRRENGKIVVWGDKAYIFSETCVLITVLQIPSSITPKMKNMIVATAA